MNLPHLSVVRATIASGTVAALALSVLVAVLPASATPPASTPPPLLAAPDIALRPLPGSVVAVASAAVQPTTLARALGAVRQRTRPLTTTSYRMVALTWRGAAGELRIRTRRSGTWSPWRVLEPMRDVPDAASGEGTGTRGTELTWIDRADGIQVETPAKRPRDLRVQLIDPGVLPTDDDRALAPAAVSTRSLARRAGRYTQLRPPIWTRRQWGADESWRNAGPFYGNRLQQVHIHHTASGNTYGPAEVPALLRGFYRYHTGSLGWNDIGYNFLVDRWGRTWEGRAGGMGRIVMGAHTLGFNATSTGIAVMGNYQSQWPGRPVLFAVARIAAWKLNPSPRVQPRRWTMVYSHGSDNYPAGRWVPLPVIDGHRDTNDTACPGWFLYARLPWIRQRAQGLVNAW